MKWDMKEVGDRTNDLTMSEYILDASSVVHGAELAEQW